MVDGPQNTDGPEDKEGEEDIAPRSDFHLHRYDSTGAFVIPRDNTWAAHNYYIKASNNELTFNPQRYDYFDGVLAEKLGKPEITDPKHADYAKFAALRRNIAVLRNYILVHYQESGEFKDGAKPQIERISSIAEGLGQALNNDKWGTRALMKFASLDIANIDGVGAMEMYKHLLEIQEKPTTRQPLIAGLKSFLALPERDWRLPQLAESPFHPAALAAPAPDFISTPLPKTDSSSDTYSDSQAKEQETKETTGQKTTKPEAAQENAPEEKPRDRDAIAQSILITEHIVQVANKMQKIDTLAEAPRGESVEEARKILRNLRNMEFHDHNIEEFLDLGSATAVVAKKQAFSRLATIFSEHLKQAQNNTPSSTKTAAVQQAHDTVCTIALELAEHTRRMLANDDEREERLNQLIDSLPAAADLRINQSVDRLLETLELGLEHTMGQELATSSLERLLLSGERLEKHAVLLHEGATEEEPTREESIALARSVLARLEEMPMGNRTLQEFVDTAPPKEQAAFAQAVEELADIYHNIITEASKSDPGITQDPRVKQANDTIAGFAHAVNLMAAKEMPNSIASAQRIGAEASEEPQQWKDMCHHAVNRLIKSAEGGLEKAIGEIAMDVEEEQDEDVAQEIMEAGLQHSEESKRKKRRRGEPKSRSSAKSGKKQKKKHLDLTADDRAAKQGIYAEDNRRDQEYNNTSESVIAARAVSRNRAVRNASTRMGGEANDRAQGTGRFENQEPPTNVRIVPTMQQQNRSQSQQNRQSTTQNRNTVNNRPVAPQGLKESDLAAIAKLGGSLRNIGNQLQGMNVNTIDKVDNRTPSNKQPDPLQNPMNPRNQQGPGK